MDTVAQLRASWSVNNSPLASGLKQGAKMLSSFQKRYQGFGNVELKAQYKGLLSDLKTASKPLDKFKKDYSEIQVGFAATGVKETVAAVSSVGAAASAVDGTNANVEVGTTGVPQTVSALGVVKNSIEETKKEALALGATSVRFTVGENGALRTAFTLKQVDEEADKLDGRKINLSFGAVDRKLGEALPSMLGDVSAALERFNVVSAIASSTRVPALLSGYAGLAAGSVQLAGASVSLGTALVGGVAAGVAQVGAAFVSGGAALYGYQQALSRTYDYAANFNDILYAQRSAMNNAAKITAEAQTAVDNAVPGTKEYELATRGLTLAKQDEAHQTARLNAMLQIASPSVIKLNADINETRLGMLAFGGSIANIVAPTLSAFIKRSREIAPTFSEGAKQMMRDMNGVAGGFLKAATSGLRLQTVTDLVNEVFASGRDAAKLMGDAVLIVIDVLGAMDLKGSALVGTISNLVGEAEKWTSSVEGQQRISEVWNEMKIRGAQLWSVVRDLGIGFGQVISAANSADFGGTLLGGLQRFASGFREATAAGTETNNKIRDIARVGGPLIAEIGNFAKVAAQEFFRVATAVSGIRVGKNDLPVLQAFVAELTKTLPGFADMFIENFERIAPSLIDLTGNIAEFFEVFTPADPALVATLDALNFLFDQFQKLPEPMQRTIGRIIGVTVALNGLSQAGGGPGLGGLVSSVAGLGTNLFLANRYLKPLLENQKKLNTALTNMPNITGTTATPVSTLPATGPAVKKTWTTRLAAFARTLAPIAIVATLVVTFDQQSAAEARQKAQEEGRGSGQGWAAYFQEGVKGWPILGSIATWIDNFQRGVFARLGNVDKANLPPNVVLAMYQFFFQEAKQKVLGIATTTAGAILLPVVIAFQKLRQIAFAGAAAVVLSVAQGWQRLRQTTSQAWAGVTAFVGQAWVRIKQIALTGAAAVVLPVVQGWQRVRQATSAAWNFIVTLLSGVWQRIRQTALAGVNQVRVAVTSGWQTVRSLTQSVWNFIVNLLAQAWQRIRQNVLSGVQTVRSVISQGWNFIKSNTQAAWSAVRDFVVNRFTEAKSRAGEIVGNLRSSLSSAWDAIKSGASSAWQAIAEVIWKPIEGAVSKVRSFIETIVNVVNSVLSAFGQKTISLGGSTGGTGSTGGGRGTGGPYQQMATGGVIGADGVRAFAKGGSAGSETGGSAGGMGTEAKQPRVHLWNEQVGPEAYVVKNRPTREQLPYLREAASWHGQAVVPANPGRSVPSSYHDFAEGGLVGGLPVRAFAGGGIGAMYEQVKEKYGVEGFNNHGSYLSEPAASNSLDFMVTTPGNMAQGSEKELGDNIASFVAPPSTVTTIWYGQANYGSGWQPYSTGPGVGNANTLAHYDHVHAQAHPDSFRGGTGSFPGGGGGGGGFFEGPSLADEMWNGGGAPDGWKGAVQKALIGSIPVFGGLLNLGREAFPGLDKLLPKLPGDTFGSGLVPERVAEYVGGYKEWVKDWIYSKFDSSGGPGGSLPGGKSPSGLTIGEALSKGGWPEDLLIPASSTVYHESTGNARAQNPSGARGLMQIMPETASGVGADYDKLYDPIYNTSAGKKVYDQAGGFGPWVAAGRGGDYRNEPVTGYDKGGLIPGSIGDPKLLMAHAGEIVLPQGISKSFLDFASSLREATRINIPQHRGTLPERGVPELSERVERVVSGARREAERFRSEIRSETDEETKQLLRDIRDGLKKVGIDRGSIDRLGSQVDTRALGTLGSKRGQTVIERQMSNSNRQTSGRGGRP